MSIGKSLSRIVNRRAKKKAAMEAKKVKIQDEKDMLDVQGAKDGGRMGYKHGGAAKRGQGCEIKS